MFLILSVCRVAHKYIKYLLLPPKSGANPIPNNPSDVSCSRRGFPSTVVPALITLLFLPTPLVPPPCPFCSSSPHKQGQMESKMSSNPVDSNQPFMVELLEMVLEVLDMPGNILGSILEFKIIDKKCLKIMISYD